jgi:arylsulfatase A-like enzyme
VRGVLLISLDTLRPDHLGAYGYARPTSPHRDRLAAEGVLFEVALSVSPWTLPAHATLLTGRLPHQHGVRRDDLKLAPGTETLAVLLQRVGFDTAAIVNHLFLGTRYGLHRGFDFFRQVAGPEQAPSSVADQALGWLGARAADDPDPFFLFLHFYDTHSDYRALERYESLFARPYDGPIDGSTEQLREVLDGERRLAPEDRQRLIDLYDASVRQLDAEVGRLLAGLEQRGWLDETLVVVTSDHGEEFLEHGGVLHARTHYEELLRIPLIWRGPGLPRGVRVAEPVSLADVAPTLLARLGVAGSAVAGRDLAPLWSGGGRGEERFVVADGDRDNAEPDRYQSIRGSRYKLIRERRSGTSRLYDLVRDPGEQRDLADREPGRRDDLARRLDAFLAEGAGEATAAEPLGEDELEQLRALGYLAP